MANYNKVMLMGNLTRDPELRFTPKGQAVADIGLAVNRYYTIEATGEKKTETTFVDVTLWGRHAEIAKEYLSKGKPLFVEGHLVYDTWDDKQSGQKRSKLKVTAEAIQLIGGRDEAGASSRGRAGYENGGGTSGGGRQEFDTFDQSRSGGSGEFGSSSNFQSSQKSNSNTSISEAEDDDVPF